MEDGQKHRNKQAGAYEPIQKNKHANAMSIPALIHVEHADVVCSLTFEAAIDVGLEKGDDLLMY